MKKDKVRKFIISWIDISKKSNERSPKEVIVEGEYSFSSIYNFLRKYELMEEHRGFVQVVDEGGILVDKYRRVDDKIYRENEDPQMFSKERWEEEMNFDFSKSDSGGEVKKMAKKDKAVKTESKVEVKALLEQLKNCKDNNEKKKLRGKLRRAGHFISKQPGFVRGEALMKYKEKEEEEKKEAEEKKGKKKSK